MDDPVLSAWMVGLIATFCVWAGVEIGVRALRAAATDDGSPGGARDN